MFYDAGMDYRFFEAGIKAMKKYYDIITLDKFINIIQGNEKLKKNSALLTFDDADSEFIKYAWPILNKYNCPGVIFAPTNCIENKERIWHLRISNIFHCITGSIWEKIKNKSDILPEKVKQLVMTSTIANKDQITKTCRAIIGTMDKVDHNQVDEIIDQWEEIADIDYKLGIECMNWDELKQVSDSGINIDSHTVRHRKLATLNKTEIEKELVDSKATLENKLQKSVQTICYPAGSYNDDVVALSQDAGYIAGFTTQTGTCTLPLEDDEAYRIPRLAMYGEDKYEINYCLGMIALKELLKG